MYVPIHVLLIKGATLCSWCVFNVGISPADLWQGHCQGLQKACPEIKHGKRRERERRAEGQPSSSGLCTCLYHSKWQEEGGTGSEDDRRIKMVIIIFLFSSGGVSCGIGWYQEEQVDHVHWAFQRWGTCIIINTCVYHVIGLSLDIVVLFVQDEEEDDEYTTDKDVFTQASKTRRKARRWDMHAVLYT